MIKIVTAVRLSKCNSDKICEKHNITQPAVSQKQLKNNPKLINYATAGAMQEIYLCQNIRGRTKTQQLSYAGRNSTTYH